jgi:hypothetical protein
MTSHAHSEKFKDVNAKRATWKKWPKTAYKHKLCIFDWPDVVDPPGPNFDYKSLSMAKLHQLIGGYVRNKQEETDEYVQPNVVPWGKGDGLSLHALSPTYETLQQPTSISPILTLIKGIFLSSSLRTVQSS